MASAAQPPLSKQYELAREVGSGHFGTVYIYSRLSEGQDSDLPQQMAVKVVPRSSTVVRADQLMAASKLSHHPNLISVFGIEETEGDVLVKMEVATCNLAQLREAVGYISETSDFLGLAQQLAKGMDYLHSHGMAHGDIKPQNVLVFSHGSNTSEVPKDINNVTFKLSDFGLFGQARTTGSLYMAPEVAKATRNGTVLQTGHSEADVFSLGVLFYEVLVGRAPFTFEELCAEHSKTPDLATLTDCEDIATLLGSMLTWDVSRRLNALGALVAIRTLSIVHSKLNTVKKINREILERSQQDISAKNQRNERHLNPSPRPQLQSSPVKSSVSKEKLNREFLEAVGKGDLQTAEELLAKHSDLLGQGSPHPGGEALRLACVNGHVGIVQLLLEKKAKVDQADKDGNTVLSLACQNSQTSTARLLITYGADVNKPNALGWMPVHFSCQNGDLELTRAIIETGANINVSNKTGWTPLHLACNRGHFAIVQLLIKHGSDANASDHDGWTPLHRAADSGHSSIARMLVDHGAEIDRLNRDGLTALHLACWKKHREVAQMLLERKARVDSVDGFGRTPLHWAYNNEQLELADQLVVSGASPGLKDYQGLRPFELPRKRMASEDDE